MHFGIILVLVVDAGFDDGAKSHTKVLHPLKR